MDPYNTPRDSYSLLVLPRKGHDPRNRGRVVLDLFSNFGRVRSNYYGYLIEMKNFGLARSWVVSQVESG